MHKDKAPGPDGFMVNLFHFFCSFIKIEVYDLVEELCQKEWVLTSLNATFITLIPKKQKGETFEDLRPISCCSMVYKIIVKIIVQRFKPIMS